LNQRTLGKTGFAVSEIGLGTWQVGGKWGQPFDDAMADRILDEAVELGITFVDTADVYSDGLSERAVGRALMRHPGRFRVATKCGRHISPHVSAGYTPEVLRRYVEDSLGRLGVETLDLIQLHCPPTEVFYRPEIFELFDRLKAEGKIQNLGVSVEKVEEGLKAMEYPSVASIQIIFNLFRYRPSELLFERAKQKNVGIIVRVPLASGLLTGKFGRETTFDPADHRQFNRDGAAFDKGETFSGVDYGTGLKAVEELKAVFPAGHELSAWALRWILMFDAVSTVIPGASRPEQIRGNTAATALPPLDAATMSAARDVYDRYIRKPVHDLW
jgi:aryl-alcohol dehydrogenase-like predicted oxidoreductase